MEWVETTGRTVADALDSALDELGVHEEDVEVEVLEEPKTGFLGRFGGSDARVRVRLKPISREKPGERRRRKGKGGRSRSEGSGRGDGPGRGDGKPRGESKGRSEGKPRGEGAKSSPGGRGPGSESRSGGRNGRSGRSGESAPKGNEMEESTVPVERQAETATEFTQGLVEAFGADADVSQEIDDGAITVRIDGDDLGLLVGPKGATLNAIEELVRAVVQRETGGHGARIHVDVAGYREKRRQALAEFTRGLVAKVLDSGNDQVLEPMPSPDRKVVHDTVAEIDGVETSSEGEEPRRYVVIRPS
ncbi:MAG: RNA-binding cell elongation regulator Jag/EloR [Acidimicrobiia bacterium]